jgi:hypothetical protein
MCKRSRMAHQSNSVVVVVVLFLLQRYTLKVRYLQRLQCLYFGCRSTVQRELPNSRISCSALRRTGDCLYQALNANRHADGYRPTSSLAFHITPDHRAVLPLDSQSIT